MSVICVMKKRLFASIICLKMYSCCTIYLIMATTIGEIPNNIGNEEFVGGMGNLCGKGSKKGEMLGNVRGLSQNCVINNQVKMNDKLQNKKNKAIPK